MRLDKFKGKNSFLSNFYPAKVHLDGIDYPSVEHAYQAAKSSDKDERLVIRASGSAAKAKNLGKRVKKLREDWDKVKLDIMYDLLLQKFAPKGECAMKLIETEGNELVEGNWWGDTFWGECGGVGENYLGKMLMNIRDELIGDK